MASSEKAIKDINVTIVGTAGCGKSLLAVAMVVDGGGLDRRYLDGYWRQGPPPRNEHYDCGRWWMGQQHVDPDTVLEGRTAVREGHTEHCVTWRCLRTTRMTALTITPGRRRLLRNALKGIALADGIILVVDAQPGRFEQDLEEGTAMEHALAAYALGVRQVVVAVTKMDLLEEGAQERYEEVAAKMTQRLRSIGYKKADVVTVPVSAKRKFTLGNHHPNVGLLSDLLPWHQGLTLWNAVDMMRPRADRNAEAPLRMHGCQVDKIGGIGWVVRLHVLAGRVASPYYRPGYSPDLLLACNRTRGVLDDTHTVHVKSMERFHEVPPGAAAGELIAINVFGAADKLRCKPKELKGCIFGNTEAPPLNVSSFTAQLLVFKKSIKAGAQALIFVGGQHRPVEISHLLHTIDKKTGKALEDGPAEVFKSEAVLVQIRPLEGFGLCVEPLGMCAALARFVLVDGNHIIGAGVVRRTRPLGFGPVQQVAYMYTTLLLAQRQGVRADRSVTADVVNFGRIYARLPAELQLLILEYYCGAPHAPDIDELDECQRDLVFVMSQEDRHRYNQAGVSLALVRGAARVFGPLELLSRDERRAAMALLREIRFGIERTLHSSDMQRGIVYVDRPARARFADTVAQILMQLLRLQEAELPSREHLKRRQQGRPLDLAVKVAWREMLKVYQAAAAEAMVRRWDVVFPKG